MMIEIRLYNNQIEISDDLRASNLMLDKRIDMLVNVNKDLRRKLRIMSLKMEWLKNKVDGKNNNL